MLDSFQSAEPLASLNLTRTFPEQPPEQNRRRSVPQARPRAAHMRHILVLAYTLWPRAPVLHILQQELQREPQQRRQRQAALSAAAAGGWPGGADRGAHAPTRRGQALSRVRAVRRQGEQAATPRAMRHGLVLLRRPGFPLHAGCHARALGPAQHGREILTVWPGGTPQSWALAPARAVGDGAAARQTRLQQSERQQQLQQGI